MRGVLTINASLTCNYNGLKKAGLSSGLKDIVIRTQHGTKKFKSMCTCTADSTEEVSFNHAYGVPGAPMPTARAMALMNTLILENVTAKNSKTGEVVDVTRHIGLRVHKPPVLIAK